MKRTFSLDDQGKFAALTGDINPMHVDPVAARRLIFGRPVVHGIHLLLWALDCWSAECDAKAEFVHVKAVFQAPLGTDEEVVCDISSSDRKVKIKLIRAGARIGLITLATVPLTTDFPDLAITSCPAQVECKDLSLEEVKDVSGSFDLCLSNKIAEELFPRVVKRIPAVQIAELLATTRLVGMECPGMNSIFSELNLTFQNNNLQSSPLLLEYAVNNCDLRFSLVSMGVKAPGMKGKIKAFIRPKPKEQESFSALSTFVMKNEFSGQKALVVGGSRGLGEVAAKLLAAGGAEVVLTYFYGYREAQNIVDDIILGGGRAQCVSFDVLQSRANIDFDRLMGNFLPSDLYYFSSPFIFEANKGSFSVNLFNKFCKYYVEGFLKTIQLLPHKRRLKIFYPSSVAIDELPQNMGEYATAKNAGETLCSFLEKANKNFKIYCPRFPRMATDQTVSFIAVDNKDPAPFILKELREFRDM